MNDYISRQAAIDELDKWESKYTWDFWCNEHKDEPEKYHITAPSALIASLPSAQTEIIHCRDCKYSSPNGKYGCKSYHYRLYETHVMKPDDFCSYAERRTDGKEVH